MTVRYALDAALLAVSVYALLSAGSRLAFASGARGAIRALAAIPAAACFWSPSGWAWWDWGRQAQL